MRVRSGGRSSRVPAGFITYLSGSEIREYMLRTLDAPPNTNTKPRQEVKIRPAGALFTSPLQSFGLAGLILQTRILNEQGGRQPCCVRPVHIMILGISARLGCLPAKNSLRSFFVRR